jgi:hypothetical protein
MADVVFWTHIYCFEKNLQTHNTFKMGPYLSDLREIGCKTRGKTRPMVPVTLPRLENVKWLFCLPIFEMFEHWKIVCSANCLLFDNHLLYTHFLMFKLILVLVLVGSRTLHHDFPCNMLLLAYKNSLREPILAYTYERRPVSASWVVSGKQRNPRWAQHW